MSKISAAITAVGAYVPEFVLTNAMLENMVETNDEWITFAWADPRSGVITIFVGSGLYMMGIFFLGDILKGAGALVGLIGVGTMIAGYLYPNTGKELTDAVEEFEKK